MWYTYTPLGIYIPVVWNISVYLFRRVFRDGAIVERIILRDRIVGNVKKNHAVTSVDKLLLKQKKLYVLRDIQYGPLLFFLIVVYKILKTISLEQLTTTAWFFFTFPTILSRKIILSTMAPSRKTRRNR
jgi:hypothetical protein